MNSTSDSARKLRLLGVFAHPDDESLGTGGTFARYAAEGVETYILTATRGERGWFGDPADYPGPETLGRIRQRELVGAAAALGVRDVAFLDYRDGELDQADPAKITAEIVDHVRDVRPDVIVTFAHDGVYGHPDHIAACQFATAAAIASGDPAYVSPRGLAPHRVAKMYYRAAQKGWFAAYEAAFGELVMDVDGVERRSQGWERWLITTEIDTSAHWQTVWDAIRCHRSQLPGYGRLLDLPEQFHQDLWGKQQFYRLFSTVNGGRSLEVDLFEGLRAESPATAEVVA